jgi:hypothetical protein
MPSSLRPTAPSTTCSRSTPSRPRTRRTSSGPASRMAPSRTPSIGTRSTRITMFDSRAIACSSAARITRPVSATTLAIATRGSNRGRASDFR